MILHFQTLIQLYHCSKYSNSTHFYCKDVCVPYCLIWNKNPPHPLSTMILSVTSPAVHFLKTWFKNHFRHEVQSNLTPRQRVSLYSRRHPTWLLQSEQTTKHTIKLYSSTVSQVREKCVCNFSWRKSETLEVVKYSASCPKFTQRRTYSRRLLIPRKICVIFHFQ